MPLKYFAGLPAFVKYTGWAHGVLFVGFIVFLLQVAYVYKWGLWKMAFAFLTSLIPFGMFILDKKLKEEAQAIKSVR